LLKRLGWLVVGEAVDASSMGVDDLAIDEMDIPLGKEAFEACPQLRLPDRLFLWRGECAEVCQTTTTIAGQRQLGLPV
jgi:hypothetical protein